MKYILIKNNIPILSIHLWKYILPNGHYVFAGKSDKDNDFLSLILTKAYDWWFHIDNIPGSHITLKNSNFNLIDNINLHLAASIAAYHSKARHTKLANVSGTLGMYIKKPKNTKHGTMQVYKKKNFKVIIYSKHIESNSA